MLEKFTTRRHASRYTILVSALILVGLPVPMALAQTPLLFQPPILEVTGAVSGTVRDSTSAKIPGVTVRISNSKTSVTQTQLTDEEGSFTFSRLKVGEYTVTASLTGFGTAQASGVQVQGCEMVRKEMTLPVAGTRPSQKPGPAISDLPTIRTESLSGTRGTFGAFSGRICNPVAGWIKGATISLLPVSANVNGDQPTPNPSIHDTSDEDGGFWIYGVPVGIYSIRVTAPGFETVTDRIRVQGAMSTRDIYLKRPTQTP